MSLFDELKRRNVIRVGTAYVVTAWLVIQVIETVLPAFGFGDAAVRYVTLAFAAGLIPALVFAWAFELTPEGLKREKDVDRRQSITPATGRRLDRMIMVVLALALAYFVFDKFVLSAGRETALTGPAVGTPSADPVQDRSIVVLPFADMSVEGDQEYFSDGISEELLNLLARIPELRVISRSSAFSFKGKDLDIPTIAGRLKVAHVLEGSVRKQGDRVRVTAQLIDAATDSHLWSETYDRTMDDIFAIQDEIAAEVVKRLKATLLAEVPTVAETDPEAYALYLQGKHLSRNLTPESLQQAVAMLRRATEIAPDFAAAWVSLAVAYNHQATYRLITADEARELSLQALEQTLRIDPDSPDAYFQLAIIASNEGDLPGAAGSYERALELQPTTGTLGNAASLLEWLGRLDESIRLQEYCMARDPTNAAIFNNLGIVYRYANRLEEARSTLSTALALNPGMMGVRYELGVVDLLDGRPEAAVDSFQQEDAEVFRQLGLAMAAHALGHDGESDRLLREVSSKYGEYVAYFIAQAHAWRGEPDEAFDWLEQAKAADWRDLNSAVNEPLLRSLYGDPRWLKFLQSIGRDPERLAAIRFEVPPPETF